MNKKEIIEELFNRIKESQKRISVGEAFSTSTKSSRESIEIFVRTIVNLSEGNITKEEIDKILRK